MWQIDAAADPARFLMVKVSTILDKAASSAVDTRQSGETSRRKFYMAANITLGIVLAFIVFGACERLIPKAGTFLGPLSGVALTLASLWGLCLGTSWGLYRLGITSNQLPGFLNTTAWLSASTAQVLLVAGVTAFIAVC